MAHDNHGGNEGNRKQHELAGHEGGTATARKYGKEFYEEIGHKGGKVSPTKFKKNDERTREIARKGGQS